MSSVKVYEYNLLLPLALFCLLYYYYCYIELIQHYIPACFVFVVWKEYLLFVYCKLSLFKKQQQIFGEAVGKLLPKITLLSG